MVKREVMGGGGIEEGRRTLQYVPTLLVSPESPSVERCKKERSYSYLQPVECLDWMEMLPSSGIFG